MPIIPSQIRQNVSSPRGLTIYRVRIGSLAGSVGDLEGNRRQAHFRTLSLFFLSPLPLAPLALALDYRQYSRSQKVISTLSSFSLAIIGSCQQISRRNLQGYLYYASVQRLLLIDRYYRIRYRAYLPLQRPPVPISI